MGKKNRLGMEFDQRGQGLTEYLILVLLVAVVSIGVVRGLGGVVKDKIRMARDHIEKEVVLKN